MIRSAMPAGAAAMCLLVCELCAGGEALPPKPASSATTETSVDARSKAKTVKTTRVVAGIKRIVTTVETRIYTAQGLFLTGTIYREIECLSIERRLVQQGVIEEEKGKLTEKLRESGSSLGISLNNAVLLTKELENGVSVQTMVRTPEAGFTIADLPALWKRIFNADGSITVKIWYDPAANPQTVKPDEEYTIRPEQEGEVDCPSNPKFKSYEIPPRTVSTASGSSTSPFGHPFGQPGRNPTPEPPRVSP